MFGNRIGRWISSSKRFLVCAASVLSTAVALHAATSIEPMATMKYVTNEFNIVKAMMPESGVQRVLPNYLYFHSYDDAYLADAEWYCDKIDHIGYCSSRRDGNEYSRNYDWQFTDAAVFAGSLSRGVNADGSTRFASLFISSVGTNLTDKFVSSGKWSRYYKCLPGVALDGINENGIVCNINVVHANGSGWETRGSRDLNMLMAVRWVLDHSTSADAAAHYVAEHGFVPASTLRLGYSLHMMVADEHETWVVEDGNCRRVGTSATRAVMTNFRVLSDADDPYGSGYERYDILMRDGSSIKDAWYTNAYKPVDGIFPWPTEFADPQIGKHTETNKLQKWAHDYVLPKLPPKRDGKWWQTVHSTIYDIAKRTMKVAVQEQDDWYVFSIPETASRADLPAKRDRTDMEVYRKVKDCWTWKNWNNPEEPDAREAPADFLAFANSPGSDPIYFREGAWWGAVHFWPNGKVKYSQSEIPPGGTGELSTSVNFAMYAYDETGTNEIFRFGATATRTDPTNETVVSWSDKRRNQFVRVATTDFVVGEVSKLEKKLTPDRRTVDPTCGQSGDEIEMNVATGSITTVLPTNGVSLTPGVKVVVKCNGSKDFSVFVPNEASVIQGLPVTLSFDIPDGIKTAGTSDMEITRLPVKAVLEQPYAGFVYAKLESIDDGTDWTPVITNCTVFFDMESKTFRSGEKSIEGFNLQAAKSLKVTYAGADGAEKTVTLMELADGQEFIEGTFYGYAAGIEKLVSETDAPSESSPVHATFSYETVNGSSTFEKDIEVTVPNSP